jgi:hypothetical protein
MKCIILQIYTFEVEAIINYPINYHNLTMTPCIIICINLLNMAARNEVLRLYRSLLRESNNFNNYNYRLVLI